MAVQSSADFHGNLGRYALFGEIASGGMATVHVARLIGPVGFARTVAIKRLHPHLSKDPDFVAMFLEEARLAARVRHPNVVSTLDVVDEGNELFLVMEYVAGESLSRLVRKTREAGERVPPRYVAAIMCAALEGLHAAHEATSERGVPLGIVHRDVSPQNIHVGLDGVARVLDFGIAKATNRVQETRTDQIKGKVAYMSPEQLAKGPIDRRADVYAASVILWEALTSQRLFKADEVPALVYSIMNDQVVPPSALVPDISPELDAIVMKGLDREASKRWSSAREMAVALERVLTPAPAREIGEWVHETAGELLAWRIELVHRIESQTSTSIPPPPRLRADTPFPTNVTSAVMRAPALPTDAGALDQELLPAPADGEDDDDDHETLQRPSSAFGLQPAPPPASVAARSKLSIAVGMVLLFGVMLLVARIVQVGIDASPLPAQHDPVAAASAEHEPAISLEASRSALTATPKTSAPTEGAPSRPTSSATDCSHPFVIDAKGVRHPKPHCIKR